MHAINNVLQRRHLTEGDMTTALGRVAQRHAAANGQTVERAVQNMHPEKGFTQEVLQEALLNEEVPYYLHNKTREEFVRAPLNSKWVVSGMSTIHDYASTDKPHAHSIAVEVTPQGKVFIDSEAEETPFVSAVPPYFEPYRYTVLSRDPPPPPPKAMVLNPEDEDGVIALSDDENVVAGAGASTWIHPLVR